MKRFRIRDRIINADLNEIIFGEKTVHVEPKMMAVLCELASSPGQVISRERLLERVWAGVFVGGDVLTNSICVLRRALGETAAQPELIQTIPRRGYRLTRAVQEVDQPESSVVVLPFDCAWNPKLGEQAANEITAELARCPGIRVIHSPHQRITNPEPAEYIVFGNIRTCDGSCRITATLLFHRYGVRPVWSESHDRQIGRLELNALVTQIKNAIRARSIHPNTMHAPAMTSDMEENALVLRIRHLRHEETAFSLQDAAALAESLASMYPDCAAAHAELAQIWLQQEKLFVVQHAIAEPKVRDAIDCALRLDGASCATLTSVAIQDFRYDWNWAAAEKHFNQAVLSNPFSPDAPTEFATMLTLMARFAESEYYLTRARALDPLSPLVMLQLANLHTNSGNAAQAVPLYQELIRRNPAHLSARTGLIFALELLGNFEDAIQIAHNGFALHGRRETRLTAALVRVYALSGQHRNAWHTLERLVHATQDPFLLACAYSAFGERARVMRLLSAAAECGHARLVLAAITPRFAGFHDDRSFQALIRHLGLQASL